MWWNQMFLFLASLCVHSGFGLSLGYLVDRVRRHTSTRHTLIGTVLFSLLIYLPSMILIASLAQLPVLGRVLILLAGIMSVVLPNVPGFQRELPSIRDG